MIVRLTERIGKEMRMSFKQFSGKERTDVIVSFLALLELVKQGILRASQDNDFGDITLESDSVSTPTYG
jgi:chromatin segregation and condensation protein Rec8/ScpA/Scc1 (kleisin family)